MTITCPYCNYFVSTKFNNNKTKITEGGRYGLFYQVTTASRHRMDDQIEGTIDSTFTEQTSVFGCPMCQQIFVEAKND